MNTGNEKIMVSGKEKSTVYLGGCERSKEEAEQLTVSDLQTIIFSNAVQLDTVAEFLHLLYTIAYEKADVSIALIPELVWEMYRYCERARVNIRNAAEYLERCINPERAEAPFALVEYNIEDWEEW